MRVRYSGKWWSRRRPSCRYTAAPASGHFPDCFFSHPSSRLKCCDNNVRQNLLEERLKNPSPSLEERIERAKRRAHQLRVKIKPDAVKAGAMFVCLVWFFFNGPVSPPRSPDDTS